MEKSNAKQRGLAHLLTSSNTKSRGASQTSQRRSQTLQKRMLGIFHLFQSPRNGKETNAVHFGIISPPSRVRRPFHFKGIATVDVALRTITVKCPAMNDLAAFLTE